MKIVFLGTPEFAAASLQALIENNFNVAGAVTAPDYPAGRGLAPRMSAVKKKALEKNAVSLILCHNHPTGSLKPSRADEELTHKIKEASKYFDIKVLDHLIVSEEGYYSFADEGLL